MAIIFAMPVIGQTNQEWRDSLEVLKRQIAVMPYSSDLHLKKAAVNIEMGQWEYAIDEYSFVLQKEPENLAALYYRAYAQSRMRRYDLARVDYERFLGIAPNNLEARLGLSYMLLQLGKDKEALMQMNTMVEMFHDSAIVYATRAALEKEMGALEAALLDWEDAIRLEPDNTDYMLSKADILIVLNKKGEAKTVLDAIAKKGIPHGMLREWYDKCK